MLRKLQQNKPTTNSNTGKGQASGTAKESQT